MAIEIILRVVRGRFVAFRPILLRKEVEELDEALDYILIQGFLVRQMIEVRLLSIKKRLEEVADLNLDSLLRGVYQMLDELAQER